MKNKVNIDTVGWLWGASVGRVWLTERAHILETEDNKRGGVQNSSLTLLEDIRGGGCLCTQHLLCALEFCATSRARNVIYQE